MTTFVSSRVEVGAFDFFLVRGEGTLIKQTYLFNIKLHYIPNNNATVELSWSWIFFLQGEPGSPGLSGADGEQVLEHAFIILLLINEYDMIMVHQKLNIKKEREGGRRKYCYP